MAVLGKNVALSGSLGCCGIAHDIQHLEYPEEVWAAWRALSSSQVRRPEGRSATFRVQGLGFLFLMDFFHIYYLFPDSAISPPILMSYSSRTEACNIRKHRWSHLLIDDYMHIDDMRTL